MAKSVGKKPRSGLLTLPASMPVSGSRTELTAAQQDSLFRDALRMILQEKQRRPDLSQLGEVSLGLGA